MDSFNRCLVFGFLVFGIYVSSPEPLPAQQDDDLANQTLDEPEFAGVHAPKIFDGDAMKALNQMLSLEIRPDGVMGISSETWDQFGKSDDARIEEQLNKFLEHMPESMKTEAQLDSLRGQFKLGGYTSQDDVFENLAKTLEGAGGSRSSSGRGIPGGMYLVKTFDSRRIKLFRTKEHQGFELSDTSGTDTQMQVSQEPEKKKFLILIESPVFLLRLSQSKEKISVVMSDGSYNKHLSAESWETLMVDSAKEYRMLMATLANFGFKQPVEASGEQVDHAVLQGIRELTATENSGKLDEWVGKLESNDKAVSAKALVELTKLASHSQFKLESLARSDQESAEKEFRSKLLEAVRASRRASKQDQRIIKLVLQNQICHSPEFLIGMLKRVEADDQQVVFERLRNLTEQKFGNEIALWREWLAQNPASRVNEPHLVSKSVDATKVDDGIAEPFAAFTSEARAKLRSVICLDIDEGGSIRLDRDSWKRNASTYEEMLEREIATYRERFAGRDGFDPEEWARRSVRKSETDSDQLLELLEVYSRAVGGGGFGRTGAGDDVRATFGGQNVLVQTWYTRNRVELEFSSIHGAGERLMVVEHPKSNQVEIKLQSASRFMKFIQADEKLQVIRIDGESAQRKEFRSWAELMASDEGLAREALEWMQKWGVDTPPTRESPKVAEAVFRQIYLHNSDGKKELDQKVKQLESETYAEREEAINALKQNHEVFLPLILALDESKLSIQVRQSLDEFKKYVDAQTNTDQRYSQFVTRNGLMDSPAYLIGLLGECSPEQKTLVVVQLERVTNESFGGDLRAWNDWLVKNQSKLEKQK